MNIVPKSFVARRWADTLSALQYGKLEFVTPQGDVWRYEGSRPGPHAHFAIKDWDVIRRGAARGDIGLGEDYIAGAWTSRDVETLIAFFLVNMQGIDSYAHGNFFHRCLFTLLNSVLRKNSRSGSARNIKAHYDVGNDFYKLWLDASMTYSSALFPHPDAGLEAAQQNKYRRILGRFPSQPSRALEIGCGWGGFAEEAVAADHELTGITISPAQYDFARERLNGKAEIRLQDYRDVDGEYDMIVSIEMFEAVGERYWPQYFQLLAERLRRGGRAIIQTILVGDEFFSAYRTRSDFIRHYVFPGGMLPSLSRFRASAARVGLKMRDGFAFGDHYVRTLRAWRVRLQAARDDIFTLGYDEAFLRNWEFYLAICAAAFAVKRTDVAQIELVKY
jgi:cyclopropane-fatty-acyl-phospholipid synthase